VEQLQQESASKRDRPDPAFKYLTRQVADAIGLEAIETEFPQTLRADLILAVPENLGLENTLFDFCRSFNVLEFKGQEDQLDEAGFVKNEVRVNLLFLQNPAATFENTLNILVSSRLPRQFFNYMKLRKCRFRKETGRPWQWRCRVGLQEVVVIVCRELPIEPRYYEWLVFSPAGSLKWQNFVRVLAREGNLPLLETVQRLSVREYRLMTPELKKIISEYQPEKRKQYLKEWAKAFGDMLPELEQETPEELTQAFSSLSAEQRQRLLKLLIEQETRLE